jgi:trk system potassium uptake protein
MTGWLRRLGPGLNWRLIAPVIGGALLAVGLGMVVCVVVALGDGGEGLAAFGLPAAVLIPLSAALLFSERRLRSMPLRPRDGFFAVTMGWLLAAVVGTVPFLLQGTFERPVDAFFESMSGFTTTGATMLGDIEAEPAAILMWRSISQWIGGIGIVVLVVAIAPATGMASQRVFYAETSGVTAERLTARIADTAKIIFGIFLVITGVGFLAYWIAGMTPWDAVNHTFTSVATAGFSTRNASIGAFDSLAIEIVAIALMTAGGINFAFYWLALQGRDRIWPQASEVRAYLLILLASILVATLTVWLSTDDAALGESLRGAAFSVTSILTTTGYTTVDFDAWHEFGRMHLLLLMFIGGCAGSTAGGMKVIRVMLLGKAAAQEVQRQLRPRAVQVLRIRGRVYPEEVRRGVFGFFSIYIITFAVGVLALAAVGMDTMTSISGAAATLNIIGPGLGDIGATENYAAIPEGGLWLMTLFMLIGRLEVFTLLVLLTPAFWRPNVA